MRADSPTPAPVTPEEADLSFPPTRAAALERLEAFAPRAGRDYAEGRNHDLPGHPHVSSLSPYLRHRVVTEAEVCAAVLARHPRSAADAFVSEVAWRTYFKGWLERRPDTWPRYLRGVDRALDRVATEAGLRRGWEDACEGRTGIAPFDDWARELVRTGYVHNHARMWFASVWIHTLRLPWELGADFFIRHLLDGDPASNTLSWRWVAGLHTRGKHYLARASNVARYTGGRYDPDALAAQLAPDAEPLDEGAPPDPVPAPEDEALPGGRVGLLMHHDDLHPGWLWRRGLRPERAAALIAPEGRSPLKVARKVHDFTAALAEDALRRLDGRTQAGDVMRSPAQAIDWAEGLDAVVVPHAPVGPMRDAVDALAERVRVVRPLRDWDAAAFPHCTGGYFKLRKRIPALLETIGEDG